MASRPTLRLGEESAGAGGVKEIPNNGRQVTPRHHSTGRLIQAVALGGADARAFAVVQGRSSDVGAGIRRSTILRNLPSDKRKGACRHLIVDRMDITGARLSVSGAEAILRLRSLRSSGDFDASRYAGKPVPAEEFQAMLLRQKTSPGSVPRG